MTSPLTVLWLQFMLISDGSFGRGDGVAGVIDAEVQHDEFGLPYLGGKTLKGLLAAQCAEILFALEQIGVANLTAWKESAAFLFGQPGSGIEDISKMQVGHAQLPNDLREALRHEFRSLEGLQKERREQELGLKRMANLESLTTLRLQTAMDPVTGASLQHSLRTTRVILRETPFVARLDFTVPLPEYAKWLLAACTKAFRQAGGGRHRGLGRLKAELYPQGMIYEQEPYSGKAIKPVTELWFGFFSQEVRGESAHVSHSGG